MNSGFNPFSIVTGLPFLSIVLIVINFELPSKIGEGLQMVSIYPIGSTSWQV